MLLKKNIQSFFCFYILDSNLNTIRFALFQPECQSTVMKPNRHVSKCMEMSFAVFSEQKQRTNWKHVNGLCKTEYV